MWFLPLIGAGISAAGQYGQSQQQAQMYEDEATTADKNAELAAHEANYNAYRQSLASNQKIGSMEADYGASGVTADSGSVLEIIRQAHTNAELDRQSILYGGKIKQAEYEQRALAARTGAKNTKDSVGINMASALFNGGSRAAMNYGGGSNGYSSDGMSSGYGNMSPMSNGGSFGQRGM